MSALRDRLRQLRGRPGAAADADVRALAQRIERLRAGRAGAPAGARIDGDAALAHALEARRVSPGLLLLEREIPLGFLHGNWPLRHPPPGGGTLSLFGDVTARDWLFLDTETTGLAGGSGTLAFQVGLARFEADCLRVRQYLITRFDAETAMLRAVAEQVRGGDNLVSYNGKSYDLPLLAARYRLSDLGNPFADMPHLDLLHPVRKRFGRQWENCRLATLERELLGLERQDDLPGGQAPKAWLDYLRSGLWRPLQGVLRHNRLDLLSLAAGLDRLERPAEKPPVAPRALHRARHERLRALRAALDRVA